MAYVNKTKLINEANDRKLSEPIQEKLYKLTECGPSGCKVIWVPESLLTSKHKATLVGQVIKDYQDLPKELQDIIKSRINGN